ERGAAGHAGASLPRSSWLVLVWPVHCLWARPSRRLTRRLRLVRCLQRIKAGNYQAPERLRLGVDSVTPPKVINSSSKILVAGKSLLCRVPDFPSHAGTIVAKL